MPWSKRELDSGLSRAANGERLARLRDEQPGPTFHVLVLKKHGAGGQGDFVLPSTTAGEQRARLRDGQPGPNSKADARPLLLTSARRTWIFGLPRFAHATDPCEYRRRTVRAPRGTLRSNEDTQTTGDYGAALEN